MWSWLIASLIISFFHIYTGHVWSHNIAWSSSCCFKPSSLDGTRHLASGNVPGLIFATAVSREFSRDVWFRDAVYATTLSTYVYACVDWRHRRHYDHWPPLTSTSSLCSLAPSPLHPTDMDMLFPVNVWWPRHAYSYYFTSAGQYFANRVLFYRMPPVLMWLRYQNNVCVKADSYCSDTVVSIVMVDVIVTDCVTHRSWRQWVRFHDKFFNHLHALIVNQRPPLALRKHSTPGLVSQDHLSLSLISMQPPLNLPRRSDVNYHFHSP
jgi:hypothetical protein